MRFWCCAGLGEGKVFIASETTAFNRYTKNFIAMKVTIRHQSATETSV